MDTYSAIVWAKASRPGTDVTRVRSGPPFLQSRVKASSLSTGQTHWRGCAVCPISSAAAAESLQSCPTLRDPIDGSPPGSSVPGILQARTRGCHFLLQHMKVKSESEVAQSCPTLSDPMDWSAPGSSVHGIFQARVLEWGAIAFS